MKHRIFVYGTLRRDGSQHHRMRAATWIANASVKGVLYHIDWYPAIVLSTEAEASVRGEIFMVDDDILAELDLFEGKEYKRVLVNATDEQGHTQQAWIWAAWEKPNKPIILSGDWLQR